MFDKGKLVYWTVCKGHLTDISGPVPAGYNPNAKEIYAECLRIPPVKIWDRGKPRYDVLNMIFANMRALMARQPAPPDPEKEWFKWPTSVPSRNPVMSFTATSPPSPSR